MLKPINLKNELDTIAHTNATNHLLNEVNALLAQAAVADTNTLADFKNIEGIAYGTSTQPQPYQVNQVYSIEAIKQICLQFRLRFLPADLYKGTLPYEALKAAQAFKNNLPTAELHIVAPAEFFQLKDQYADPLLFAKAGNGYVLLHQWGDDFKPTAKLVNYPWQNVKTAAITIVLAAIILTIIANATGITPFPAANPLKGLLMSFPLFVISTMFFATVALIYGLVAHKDLSEDTWNSKFYN